MSEPAAEVDPRPLTAYAALAGTFSALLGGLVAWQARRGRLPSRIPPSDVLLLGLATRQVARVLARDKVAAWLRAPFTQFDPEHGGEAEEVPAGRGLRRAVGELLLCPYCIAMWVAGAFTAALLFAPRTARAVASLLCVYGVSAAIPELSSLVGRRAERA